MEDSPFDGYEASPNNIAHTSTPPPSTESSYLLSRERYSASLKRRRSRGQGVFLRGTSEIGTVSCTYDIPVSVGDKHPGAANLSGWDLSRWVRWIERKEDPMTLRARV